MGRRAQIQMSDDEVLSFLEEERTVICATNGPRGLPHLMPLWYVVRPTGDGGAPELWAWTFSKSQKAVNIGRDPRATLQVEAGESYDQLRGLMFECDVVVHDDVEDVRALGLELYARYATVDDDVRAMVDAQAPKRIAMQFVERRRATWDHRKLGGVY
jgi:nitroimidazol reductase NimA-like FMN-containing flavoprotein (pyridoxamine 5'-phosphate oxidase superfamily)